MGWFGNKNLGYEAYKPYAIMRCPTCRAPMLQRQYGGGGYDLYVARNEDGKVIGFKIDFVGNLED